MRGLRGASQIVGKFRSDVVRLGTRLAKLGTGLATIGAGAVGFGLARTIKSLSDLAKTSDKLSIEPTPLIALRDAAQESGVQVRVFDMAMQRMLRRVQEASRGTGEAKDTLKDLGLNARLLAKQKPEEQFVAIAKAMDQASEDGLDLSRAMKLFDSEGVKVINTLRLINEKGLDSFIDGVRRSGREVSRAQLDPAESVEDRIKRLTDNITGLFVRLAKAVTPSLDRMLEKLERFTQDPKNIQKIQDAFRDLAAEINKADETLRSFFKFIEEKAAGVKTFGSDVSKVTSAIGTMAGGIAASVRENFSGGNIAGTPGRGVFEQALDDATQQLGDIPDRIKATAGELMDGALEWGRELRRSVQGVMDDLTGRAPGGGTIRRSSDGGVTTLGNPEAVNQLRQINDTLKRGVGFGTNPSALPPGTMIIKVQG